MVTPLSLRELSQYTMQVTEIHDLLSLYDYIMSDTLLLFNC